MKKILLVGVLALIAVSCGNKSQTSEGEGTAKELTIHAMHNGVALNPEWPVFKKAEELTGVKIISTASQNQTDENQAYNLMLASKPLPDLISHLSIAALEKLGIEGGLIPLQDLIEKHAPNIKKFFDEHPRYKKEAIATDGNIYVIPNYYDYENLKTSKGYFIRKDWLDKLGLPEPKTVVELHNALLAFRDKDPNGNGKKDEVPIFLRASVTIDIIGTLTDIFKIGTGPYLENGVLTYAPKTEKFKVAIRNLAQWYKEGLIDKEIFTRKMTARDYMLSNNLGGFTSDWIVSTSSYNTSLKDKIPGFNFAILLPPEFNGDRQTRQSRPITEGAVGISVDAKDPVAMIKWLDFWYTEEGRRLYNFGIEGKEYVVENGEPKFTDEVLKDPEGKTPLQVLRSVGAQFRLGAWQDYRYELAWATPEAKENILKYIDNNAVYDSELNIKLTTEEVKQITKISASISAYLETKVQSWILGTNDVDKEWDEFVKTLDDKGLPKLMETYKAAYERSLKNN